MNKSQFSFMVAVHREGQRSEITPVANVEQALRLLADATRDPACTWAEVVNRIDLHTLLIVNRRDGGWTLEHVGCPDGYKYQPMPSPTPGVVGGANRTSSTDGDEPSEEP